LICGGAAQAQPDESAHTVWAANLSIGAAQSAELILDNASCPKSALVNVITTDSQGSTTQEVVHVGQGGIALYDVSAPVGTDDRRHFGIEVQAEPGRCLSRLQAALAIIDDVDGTTADVLHAPSHPAPIGKTGGPITDNRPINNIDVPATRIGGRQTAEFSFWNRCPVEVSVVLQLSGTGDEEEVGGIFVLDIGASEFGQLNVAGPDYQRSIVIRGFGNFVVKDRQPHTDECPPGHGLFTGNLSIVDEQGNADQASGLPTGKRQHKPVNSSSN